MALDRNGLEWSGRQALVRVAWEWGEWDWQQRTAVQGIGLEWQQWSGRDGFGEAGLGKAAVDGIGLQRSALRVYVEQWSGFNFWRSNNGDED